jgi:phosphonopyruvate decarboxylase
MINAKTFYDKLIDLDLDFFAGVPDSLLKDLCSCISDNTQRNRNIIAANEGNAVAMACGYHISSGKCGVVYMQNSGEGNAINPLLSIADPDVYSIPMLLLIGWRGEPGDQDEPQHVKQGEVTCSLLDTIGVPYEILDENWETQLKKSVACMKENNRPVALIIRKKTFEAYPFRVRDNGASLSREQALEVIIGELNEDDFVVSTTGKTSREIFEIRESRSQDHACDFLTVGGMGHTSSIAFGMAIGTDKDVWCIDGDGSFLMHMGALPIIAQSMPDNFRYILNVNGAHESVGGQPNVAQDIDVPTILKASGFEVVCVASTRKEISQGIVTLRNCPRSAMVINTHQGARTDLGRPTESPEANKIAMIKRFQSYR